MKDPIIEELWRVKDQIAENCKNDLDKLSAKIKEKEKHLRVVNPCISGKLKK
jgi:hypothetical protein